MAIKVNGTTVINDSRALSNIASVDATTVAAMGAAGVGGGASELLVDQTITSNVNYIQINFTSGYTRFIIQLNGIVGAYNSPAGMEARMTNGSNTILTSNDEYWYNNFSNSNRENREARFRYLGELSSSTTRNYNAFLDIQDPLNTTTNTNLHIIAYGVYHTDGLPYPAAKNMVMETKQANNGIRFFHQDSSYGANTSFSSNSVGYRMWGFK